MEVSNDDKPGVDGVGRGYFEKVGMHTRIFGYVKNLLQEKDLHSIRNCIQYAHEIRMQFRMHFT